MADRNSISLEAEMNRFEQEILGGTKPALGPSFVIGSNTFTDVQNQLSSLRAQITGIRGEASRPPALASFAGHIQAQNFQNPGFSARPPNLGGPHLGPPPGSAMNAPPRPPSFNSQSSGPSSGPPGGALPSSSLGPSGTVSSSSLSAPTQMVGLSGLTGNHSTPRSTISVGPRPPTFGGQAAGPCPPGTTLTAPPRPPTFGSQIAGSTLSAPPRPPTFASQPDIAQVGPTAPPGSLTPSTAFMPSQLRHRAPGPSMPTMFSTRPPMMHRPPVQIRPESQTTLSAAPVKYNNTVKVLEQSQVVYSAKPILNKPFKAASAAQPSTSTEQSKKRPVSEPASVPASSAANVDGHAHIQMEHEAGESGPSTKKEKKEKKKRFIRTAASETWEDTTLAEWDPDDFRLFCGDLGNEVNDEKLAEAFRKYPSFQKAKVVREKRTQKTKGYGFVSFKDPADYTRAMREMNGKYVGNRPIKLRKSTWKDRSLEVVKRKEKQKKALGFR